MTKFLLLILILLIFFSPVLLFLKLMKKRVAKKKESSWKGELIDKEHLEYEDDDSSYSKDLYTLHFKTDENKKIKLHVPQNIYENWKINNKAEKIKGELFPKKIN